MLNAVVSLPFSNPSPIPFTDEALLGRAFSQAHVHHLGTAYGLQDIWQHRLRMC